MKNEVIIRDCDLDVVKSTKSISDLPDYYKNKIQEVLDYIASLSICDGWNVKMGLSLNNGNKIRLFTATRHSVTGIHFDGDFNHNQGGTSEWTINYYKVKDCKIFNRRDPLGGKIHYIKWILTPCASIGDYEIPRIVRTKKEVMKVYNTIVGLYNK